ncbi:MAG TPA: ATP-binding protein [Roseiflexaceae bacterium]|nr:ATP-binding protein [Roseiflexaceae bacterium]
MPASLPAILADPDCITQVLINVLGNALQHMPAGGSVTIRIIARHRTVRFQTQDTGVGSLPSTCPISSSGSTSLTKRAYDRRHQIGLTVSKALVEDQGGAI